MRREFAAFITEVVRKDNKVLLLNMDGPGFGIFDKLRSENPNNYFNPGVTEQASIGIAAGMALEGLKPYVYSITPFVLERPFEQIKLDIVEQKANVKLGGFWNYANAGPTHRPRDIKVLCKLLDIRLYEPKNSDEARRFLLQAYKDNKPAFFHLTKDPEI